jgi:HSP20 family protein
MPVKIYHTTDDKSLHLKGGVLMPELVIWKKKQISRLKKDIDSMMERMLVEFKHLTSSGVRLKRPDYDLVETDSELVLRVDMPGVEPDNIEITIMGNVISIEGKISEEILFGDENHHLTEKRTSTFSRSIPIYRRICISKVRATYENNVLQVVMPMYSGEEKRGVRVRLR